MNYSIKSGDIHPGRGQKNVGNVNFISLQAN